MKKFRDLCLSLENTSSKNEKVNILYSYLEKMTLEERKSLIDLILSRIEGYTPSVIIQAIGDFTPFYHGDTREAVKKYLERRDYRQRTLVPMELSLSSVVSSLEEASPQHRVQVLMAMVESLDTETASLLIASLLNDLQIGVGEGLLLEAFSRLSSKSYEEMKTLLSLGGWDAVLEGRDMHLIPGSAIRPMLAEKSLSLEEILRAGNYWIEPKLDGVRILVHKKSDNVRIFSRRGTDITMQFPEIVEHARSISGDYILDGEVIALKNGKILPFQRIMRRFGDRGYVDVDFYFFDILYYNEPVIEKKYIERREILESLTPKFVSREEIEDTAHLKERFETLVSMGYEGIVAKRENGKYLMGKRAREWLKYKRTFEIDAVIVAAEWGHGRRRNYLSDYHLAVWNRGMLVEVGKTFKGLTFEVMRKLTDRLLKNKMGEISGGIVVRPTIVVEVEFEDVQISPIYRKYTLRFARIKRLREDKTPQDAAKMEEVEKIFKYLHGSV